MGKAWLWWSLAAVVPFVGMYLHAFDVFKSVEPLNVWYPQTTSGARVPTCARLDAAQLGGTEDIHLAGGLLFASSSPFRRETGNAAAAAAFASAHNISLAGRNLNQLADRVSLLGRSHQGGFSLASAAALRASAADLQSLATPDARAAFGRAAGAAWQPLPLLGWDWAAEPDLHPLGISVYAPLHAPSAPVRLAAVIVTRARSLVAVFDVVQRGPEPGAERALLSRDIHALQTGSDTATAEAAADAARAMLPGLALRTAAVLESETHIRNLNDIEFLDADTVVATNFLDTPGRDDAGAAFELLSLRRWGSVIACHVPPSSSSSAATATNAGAAAPAQCRTLAAGLAQPNGIAYESAQRRLWVSSTLDRSVSWYALRGHGRGHGSGSPDAGAAAATDSSSSSSSSAGGDAAATVALETLEIELKGSVSVGAGADNLAFGPAVPRPMAPTSAVGAAAGAAAAAGASAGAGAGSDSGAVSVWVASHPLLYRFGMTAGDPTSIAPNHVVYLSVSGGPVGEPTVSTHPVLVDPAPADTGLGSGGSSVAVPLAVTPTHMDFVVGTVFDRGVTLCRVPRAV